MGWANLDDARAQNTHVCAPQSPALAREDLRHIGGYLRVTPASASYIVWLESRSAARCAESERRGRVNRVRSVVTDGPLDLGVMIELARHWQAGG